MGVSFLFHLPLPTGMVLLVGSLSGAGWGFGQIMGFKGYQLVGSSRVLPIHTGVQMVINTLWGVLFLGNWARLDAKIMGFSALLIIVVGTYLTIWQQHRQAASVHKMRVAIGYQLIGSAGYWLYSAAPRFINLSGLTVFLPQGIGMVVAAVIYCLARLKHENAFKERVSYQQIISGVVLSLAALSYFIATQPNMLGLSTAFVLSQAYVIVSTLTGIFWLHQTKTPREMVVTLLGLALIVVAAALTAFIPN
ncbi:GRP family sugar transporter [Fructilactobacillus florum]|uniref:GRP family sugar transporter n=1 Tax=Fructilactobacillus florum TaxID=640331 RepID=UPI002092DBFD|nr:GRP family sugar transporter [Fructilactobacillus florum]